MTDNAKIVVTLKGGPGYDAPWLVFHGNTVAEALDTVSAAEASGLMVAVGKAAEAFRTHANVGGVLGASPVSPAPQQQAAPAAPQSAPQGPPGATSPTCPHGVKTYKTSKPGAAKAWKAWMCPAPQGTPDQCKPEWIN